MKAGPLSRYFFILVIIVMPLMLASQDVVFEAEQSFGHRLPYLPPEAGVHPPGNVILREMAKDVLKEPFQVRVEADVRLDFTILRGEEGYILQVKSRDIRVVGDTTFRGFPVSDVQRPSHGYVRLRWANRADTSDFVRDSITGFPVRPGDTVLHRIPLFSFNRVTDTLMADGMVLRYDSSALTAFLARLDLIHDYYASSALLDSLLAGMSQPEPVGLPGRYLRVTEEALVLERIAGRDFAGRLPGYGKDPAGVGRRYQEALRQSRTRMYNFLDDLRNHGSAVWDGDWDRLASGMAGRVLSYVARSQWMDQTQGRIYADCLSDFFTRPVFPVGDEVPGTLLARMSPGLAPDSLAAHASREVCRVFSEKAQDLLAGRHYAEAFALLREGRKVMALGGSPSASSWAGDMMAEAAEGILNAYAGIAESCIRSGRYAMADRYLALGEQYRQANEAFISSDSVYRRIFSELFFMRNAECDRLVEQSKFAEALECYDLFTQLYSGRDLERISARMEAKRSIALEALASRADRRSAEALAGGRPDTALVYFDKAAALRGNALPPLPEPSGVVSLEPKMERIRYENAYREAVTALETGRFAQSVGNFGEAREHAAVAGLTPGPEFDSLERTARKHYLVIRLYSARKLIWENRFDSADAAIERYREAGVGMGLAGDALYSSALENYLKDIRDQHCRNLADSVDLAMIRADRGIALRNFPAATASLVHALDLAGARPECSVTMQSIRDTLARYLPAANYQRRSKMVSGFIATGAYKTALDTLFVNDSAFINGDLSRFGLRRETADIVLREKGNPYLSLEGARYFAGRTDFIRTLDFLILARDQGLPEGQADELLSQAGTSLGKMAAAGVHTSTPPGHETVSVPEDRWFDAFRKAYQKSLNGNR